jgi:regulatory protein
VQITAIKQQVKNPERVSVSVDGKYSFSLSLDELLAEGLKNGQELDGSRLKKLQKLSEDGKLRARALAWVLGRPHSIREFQDYMRRKKTDQFLIDQLIEEFTAKKYLDDVAYGDWLVELRTRGGKSDRAIKAELFKKGLGSEGVDAALEASSGSEEERLRLLVAKKSQSMRYRNDPVKLAKYLTSQGFSYQLVKQVLALNQPES